MCHNENKRGKKQGQDVYNTLACNHTLSISLQISWQKEENIRLQANRTQYS